MNKFPARRPGASGNQLLHSWVTDLSGRHLIGTAAGVMMTRAVRRLQEPARWVPAALKATLFTPWSPHLDLPGRPRLQRPAHEEPIEAGASPRFIEIPTVPTTRNPKSEDVRDKRWVMPSSQQGRQRQEVIPRESQQASSSSCTATDTSGQFPDPQIPKPTRKLSPAEREDSIQKRQRPAEVNTVSTIAGANRGNEIAALMDDQNALY